MRYKVVLSYVGHAYSGWQSQKNNTSIQEKVEEALQILCNAKTQATASGRTDAGVNAKGQVFMFDSDKEMKERKWVSAMNAHLPEDIRVLSVTKVDRYFHARHSVLSKTYSYTINDGVIDVFSMYYAYQCPFPLDDLKMQEASKYLIGKHDFTAFNATTLAEMPNQIRTVSDITITRENNILKLTFTGKGFLRYMVRMMVGVLIDVGRGKITPQDVKQLLDSKQKNKHKYTAPAHGLCLEHVTYYDTVAMNEEGMIRQYTMLDEEENYAFYNHQIDTITYPQHYNFVSRSHHTHLGEMVVDEKRVHITCTPEAIQIAEDLQEDIRSWLMKKGFKDIPIIIDNQA